MPPAVYRPLLDKFFTQLASFFERVAAPIEAPEKTSFGDIDLIVTQPKDADFSIEQISTAINAKRTISAPPMYSFAVPYPQLCGSYVQLDIQVCEADNFDWEVFHKSHGDLWNLLGSSIRPFGLTANEKGLHLRIPEIEERDRRRSLVFLTADPDIVLEFLGLDRNAYAQPFVAVPDMYEYACTTRFFRPSAYVRDELRANDRKRMAQRERYRRFVEDFVPHNKAALQEIGDVERMSRVQVLEESLERFGKRDEFETRVRAWRREREELARKSETTDWRKRQAEEDKVYADAWIDAYGLTRKKMKSGSGHLWSQNDKHDS
ncbi:MAG: hypothetical protein Q9208_005151 [Pyrenodesmia sp. 3 TL-2023]